MATLKFDNICTEFIKRIPTTFTGAFTPGGGVMPESYVLPAAQISDYVNRGMQMLFNDYWAALKGDVKAMIKIFPELARYSTAIPLTAGNYTIVSPYLDFKAIIGAIGGASTYIEAWPEDKYTVALSGRYDEWTASSDEPAIIQINDKLAVFPQSYSNTIKIHYLIKPIDKSTGTYFTQNGSNDSPFSEEWNKVIADKAYLIYQEEKQEVADVV